MVKQQRIESEQRRRDDMREGFRRLYEILPPNSQKTKTVTLDRGERVIYQLKLLLAPSDADHVT